MLYKHTFSYLISKGLPAIIAFASLMIYTRLLNPEEYANYSLTVLFVSLLNGVGFQWIRFGISRFLLEYDQKNDHSLIDNVCRLYAIVFRYIAVSAVIVTGALWFAGNTYWSQIVLLAAILLCCQCTYDITSQVFISRLRPDRFAFINIMKGGLSFIVSLSLMLTGFGAKGILIGLIVGFATPVVLNIRKISNNFAFRRLSGFDLNVISQIKIYGIPLALSLCFNFFLIYSNRYMIAWLINKEAAGKFSLGVDVTEQSLSLLMGIISTPTFPIAISFFEKKDMDGFNRHMSASLSLLCSISIPAAVGLAMLSPDIITVVFGDGFSDLNVFLIPIISGSVLILGLKSYYFDIAFYMHQRTKEQFIILLPSILLCILLNYLLIPKLGYMGGAVSTFISYLFASVTTIFRTRKILRLPFPFRNILMIITAAVLMALAISAINMKFSWGTLIIKVVTGAVTYGMMLLLFNYMNLRQVIVQKVPAIWNRIIANK